MLGEGFSDGGSSRTVSRVTLDCGMLLWTTGDLKAVIMQYKCWARQSYESHHGRGNCCLCCCVMWTYQPFFAFHFKFRELWTWVAEADFVTRYFTGFRIRVNCGQWIIVLCLCRKFAGIPYFAEQRERSTSERTEADPYVHGKTLVATDFNGSKTASAGSVCGGV